MYAIDAATGKAKWKTKTGGAVFGSAAVTKVTQDGASKEVVCIASVDRKIYGLDAKTGSEIIALFERLNMDGTTIIVVTHDEDLAAAAERRLHMRDGLIVDDDG